MYPKGRKSSRGLSPAVAASTVAAAGLLAFGVCGVLLAACSALMLAGKLAGSHLFHCCCLSMGIGCFAGGLYAALSCKSRMLLVAVGAGVVCLMLWAMVGALIYGGVSPDRMGRFFIPVLVGGCLAGIPAVRSR